MKLETLMAMQLAYRGGFTMQKSFGLSGGGYRWLNTTFAVGEGVIDFTTMALRLRLFACVNELEATGAS